MRAIGSVLPFPLAEIGGASADSLWTCWTSAFQYHAAFQTARAALRALLRHERIGRLWLPAYICAETLAGAPIGCEILFYSDGPSLPFGGLKPRAGDAVLGVDYFGRGASIALREMAAERRDVLWIEDRAQAMAPEAAAWGDVVLYSPRKLIGVADGGLLVSDRPLPKSPVSNVEAAFWTVSIARFGDPDGVRPDLWHQPFQAREAAFTVDDQGMQHLTGELLKRIPLEPLSGRRRENYAHLSRRLPAYALWPDESPTFAPLAFPVRVKDPTTVVAEMARRRIFCPRHWAKLPGPASEFQEAHALSATLVSISCDHRYGEADMERTAAALKACAEPL